METYLTLLYVTLEQEVALKDFFTGKGWTYCKPDLGVMTDKVGPFENPQAFRTKTGGVITYTDLSANDEPVKPAKPKSNKTVTKKKGKKLASSPVSDFVKVEVSTEDDLTSQPDDVENEIVEESTENDDGDNDDDFADALNSSIDGEENDTHVAGDSSSPKKQGRPVRKTVKVPVKKSRNSGGSDAQEISSADQEDVSASSRKRRRVATKTDATIAAVMSEEKEETELKPLVLMKNRAREKKLPHGLKRKCSMCPKEFIFQFNLDRHYRLAHDPDNPPKPKPKHQRQKQQCDICGSVFSRSDILLEHKRRVHQGVKRVKPIQNCTCDVCGTTFKRKTHLKEHYLVQHSGSPLPHACHLCEKSFIRYRFLEMHVNRDHLKVKPFACSHCNRKFSSQFSAETHMKNKICQADRVKKFKCIRCEKKFPDSASLEMHMTAKHFGGAYSCVCGEVVKWSGSVAKHKRRCKAYQEYVAANGATEDKLCNIIEVSYDDVLLENNDEDNSSTVEKPSNDNEETASKNSQSDINPSSKEKAD